MTRAGDGRARLAYCSDSYIDMAWSLLRWCEAFLTCQMSTNHSSAQFFSFVHRCQVFYCVLTR